MAYLGNDLQVAFPTYRNIDDISGSFNGVTTSFPLTVDGVAPIPAPVNSQQCLISVNGVVQRPDDSGAEGFLLSGGNIVFASAPAGGVDFFGVILAGADYINIGANFPSGTALVPSITFDSDLDTGIYNPAGNQIGFTTAGVQRLVINSSGQVSGGLGSATTPAFSFLSDPNTGIYSPGADQVAVATNGTARLYIASDGKVGVGTTSPGELLHVVNPTTTAEVRLSGGTTAANYSQIGFHGGSTRNAEIAVNSAFMTLAHQNSGVVRVETGGSERARLDASGRLLIGSSTDLSGGDADARLQVNGDAGAQVLLSRQDFGALTAGALIGEVVFRSQASGVSETSALIKCEADATQGSGDKPGRLVFSTTADGAATPTERMRVRADGIILMNTTSTNPATTVGHQFTPSGQYFGSVADSTSATNTLHAYSTSAAAYRFYVGMDGTVNATNTTISAISDQRFKENIRDLDVGLNQILALQPRRFDWKPGKGKDIQNDQGFIAQEFEQIFPEMVGEWLDPAPEGEEPYKSVRADLIPVLVKAIQEQQAIINGLEARLAALEAS